MSDFEVILPRTEEEWQKDMNIAYNQALEDILTKVKSNHYLLSDKINSTDYGMFTCGIEQAIDELKR